MRDEDGKGDSSAGEGRPSVTPQAEEEPYLKGSINPLVSGSKRYPRLLGQSPLTLGPSYDAHDGSSREKGAEVPEVGSSAGKNEENEIYSACTNRRLPPTSFKQDACLPSIALPGRCNRDMMSLLLGTGSSF